MQVDTRLWGKTLADGALYPLLAHLLDTGAVTRAYLNGWVPADVLATWADATETDSHILIGGLASLAASHDIGKLSPSFQSKVVLAPGLPPELHAGARSERDRAAIGLHAGFGGLILCEFSGHCEDWGVDIVAGHHGMFAPVNLSSRTRAPSDPARRVARWLRPEDDDANRAQWAAQWGAHLDACTKAFGPALVLPTDSVPASIVPVLCGLVVLSDWVASNEAFLDPGGLDELDEPSRYAQRREEAAVKVLDRFIGPGFRTRSTSFPDLFSHRRLSEPNPLQAAAADLPASPGLTIVAAPMGVGKTETALLRTAALSSRSRGLYFALPTRTTADAMFTRVRDFAAHNAEATAVAGGLLHATAALNSFYLGGTDASLGDQSLHDVTTRVEARHWLRGRHKALLAPVAVGTVDQALVAVLPHRYGFLRLFALAGRSVIVDEAHSYEPYTTALLVTLVEWLAALGTDVTILSATLPTETATSLCAAYRRGATGADTAMPLSLSYPYLAHYDPVHDCTDVVPVDVPHRQLALRYLSGGRESIARHAVGEIDAVGGPCTAAVVCNTVATAQAVATELAVRFPDADLWCLHSRMPASMRAEHSAQIETAFGAGRPDRVTRHRIVVATQVIEQSLDLDVDVMVSELAPIAALLQRSGRLHRHRREFRPAGCSDPALTVVHPDGRFPRFPYAPAALERTWEAVLERGARTAIDIPNEVQTLVDLGYRWEAGDERAQRPNALDEQIAAQVDAALAGTRTIPPPGRLRRLADLTTRADVEGVLTRLGAPSVNVVVTGTSPHCWHGELPGSPGQELQRSLLAATVPLTIGVANRLEPWLDDPPPGWADRALLADLCVLDVESCPAVELDELCGLVELGGTR